MDGSRSEGRGYFHGSSRGRGYFHGSSRGSSRGRGSYTKRRNEESPQGSVIDVAQLEKESGGAFQLEREEETAFPAKVQRTQRGRGYEASRGHEASRGSQTQGRREESPQLGRESRQSKAPYAAKRSEVIISKDAEIINSIEKLHEELFSHNIGHVYGFTSTNKVEKLMRYIMETDDTSNIFFVCYRTKNEVVEQFNNIAENVIEGAKGQTSVEYDPLIGKITGKNAEVNVKINKVIYCTTAKMRNILVENGRINNDIKIKLNSIGGIIINGWDDYDANAFAIVGLVSRVAGLQCTTVLSSISRWIELPVEIERPSIQFATGDIDIKYNETESIQQITAARLKIALSERGGSGIVVYPGNENIEKDNKDIIYLATFPVRDPTSDIVIDSMKNQYGKYVTKCIADSRADTIDEGKAIRCISKTEYNKLVPVISPKNKYELNSTLLYLFVNKYPIEDMFPATHARDIKRFIDELAESQLSTNEVMMVMKTKLNLKAGMFLSKWISASIDRSEDASKIQNDRYMYVGILIACLINLPPKTYGELESYKPFAARNDIETMCKMWYSLQASQYKLYMEWTRTELAISSWCNENGFNQDEITKLYEMIKKFTLKYISKNKLAVRVSEKKSRKTKKEDETDETDKEEEVEEREFVEKYLFKTFKQLTTREINRAMIFIARVFTPKNIKWDMESETLPILPSPTPSVIYPIHHFGNKLQMYVSNQELKVPSSKPETFEFYNLL